MKNTFIIPNFVYENNKYGKRITIDNNSVVLFLKKYSKKNSKNDMMTYKYIPFIANKEAIFNESAKVIENEL